MYEILTNTTTYGDDDAEPHRIEIVVSMEGDTIVILIVDDSNAFDLSRDPESDVHLPIEDRALGGIGLFLVHQMMDGVDYRRMGGCNVVTLTKNTADSGLDDARTRPHEAAPPGEKDKVWRSQSCVGCRFEWYRSRSSRHRRYA